MGHYRSEKETAYFALRELEGHLPETPTGKADEWGMLIFRQSDPEGGYLYTYQSPYKSGLTREWRPKGRAPNGWEAVSFCHTHPNIKGFSKTDIDNAWGLSMAFPGEKCIYMINKAGAYWYDGGIEHSLYPRKSTLRYGTYWGTEYLQMRKGG